MVSAIRPLDSRFKMINERFDLQFRVELEAILVFHEQTMVGQLRQLEGKSFDFDQERLYQYSKDYLRKHIRPQVREYMSQPAYREYGRPHYTGWGITVVAGHHDNPRGEHVRYSRIGRIRTYAVEHLELARKLLRSPAPNHNNPGDFGNLFPDALEIDLYDGNTSPTHYKKWHLINDFSLVGLYKENLRAYLERHKVCEDYPRTRDITMNQPTFILPTKTPLTRTVWKNDDLPISSYPSTSGSYKTPSRGPEFSPITPDEMSGQNPSTGNHSFPSLLVPFETPPREYNGSEEPKSSPSIIWVTDIEERGEGLEGSSNNPIVISGETTEIEDPDATESAADDGVTETKVGDTGSASSKRSKVSGSKRKAGNNFRYKTPKRLKSSDLVTGVDDYNVANIMGELGLAQLNPALAGIAIEAESVSSNQATAGSTVTQSRVLSTTQGAGVEQPLSKKDKGKRKANDQGEVEYVKKIKLFEPIGPRRIDEGECKLPFFRYRRPSKDLPSSQGTRMASSWSRMSSDRSKKASTRSMNFVDASKAVAVTCSERQPTSSAGSMCMFNLREAILILKHCSTWPPYLSYSKNLLTSSFQYGAVSA